MSISGWPATALAVAGVFGLSWVSAIVYWRSGTRIPGPTEIAALMIGVPATLTGMGAWWRRRGRNAEVPPDTTPTGEPDQPHQTPFLAGIGASALVVPGGRHPADVREASASARSPSLHPRLRGHDGLPVFAIETADLDPSTLSESWAAHPVHIQRSAALLIDVVETLLAGDTAQVDAWHLALPGHWPAAQQEACRRGVEDALRPLGVGDRVELHVLSAESGVLDALSRSLSPAGPDRSIAWLTAASSLGDEPILGRSRAGNLLDSSHPKGCIPGEAAAGVVLHTGDVAPNLPRLSLVSTQPEAACGTSADTVAALLAGQLAHVSGTAKSWVVCDAGAMPSRRAVLARALHAACPELDFDEQVLDLGALCGDSDGALGLVAVLVAADAAVASGHPALALSVGSSTALESALVLPPCLTT